MKIQKSQISIEGLLAAINEIQTKAEEAGQIMAALADQDPRIYEKVLKAAPTIPIQLLYTLERVGRGQLYHALLFDNSAGARRLLTMPAVKQKEYYENPVPVVQISNGKKVSVEKPIQQLTPAEVRVAFSDTGLRSVSEQSKVLDQMNTPRQPVKAQRYDILSDGTFVVHDAETAFTPAQLQDIYERVKEKAVKSLKR